ncbi:uncharacterized protein LOC117175592 [Belonocnema kinseyi]|uniref:uncharacterized protein LOC117175592 n=1 Tax=Belonocnema kinseyi TaxID=2817044 RepID=UPI00143DC776|nr:uncharacterized protein LOC117175592 [Belonocnema kinseyi]
MAYPSISNDSVQGDFKGTCKICDKEDHRPYNCPKFLSMTTKARYETVKSKYLCTNCLRSNHKTNKCISRGCSKCGKKHNSLLHFDQNKESNENPIQTERVVNESTPPVSSYQLLIPSEVVLATAIVDVIDKQGRYHPCRLMLDSGSQPHVISEPFADKIGLRKIPADIPLEAVDNLLTNIKFTTSTTIKSRYNSTKHDLSLFIVNNISNTMPSLPIDLSSFDIPQDIVLADPNFQTPQNIDMILGAQYFYHLLLPGKIPIKQHASVLQETELGWVVAGGIHQTRAKLHNIHCNFTKMAQVPLLWELDSGRPAPKYSRVEEACEKHYLETTTRAENGRYIVVLPFNDKRDKLGNSRDIAIKRFNHLETKLLSTDSDLNNNTEIVSIVI